MKVILSILLLILLPSFCMGTSFDEHVICFYPSLVSKIEECGIQGPMAQELAQYAIIRHLHENGLDRAPSYSIPGISIGGWNENILRHVLKQLRLNISLTRCHDSEGTSLFVIEGPGANHLSSVTIAYLYDYYITVQFASSFTEKQREAWRKSKVYSYLLSCHPELQEYREAFDSLHEERMRIIRRCNGMYGPGSGRIEGEVNRLQPLFHRYGCGNN